MELCLNGYFPLNEGMRIWFQLYIATNEHRKAVPLGQSSVWGTKRHRLKMTKLCNSYSGFVCHCATGIYRMSEYVTVVKAVLQACTRRSTESRIYIRRINGPNIPPTRAPTSASFDVTRKPNVSASYCSLSHCCHQVVLTWDFHMFSMDTQPRKSWLWRH